jgi:hypothetical protein
MVLQSSGAISLNNLQTEFGGTNPISISEYYAKAINVPASGTIALSNFYGGYAIAGRGVFGGGLSPNTAPAADTIYNTLDYITISTTGNATDFGDLVQPLRGVSSCSSTTRGLFAGGLQISPIVSYENSIRYITIATTGNATDFGDLTVAGRARPAACSSSTRGIFAGGFIFPVGSPVGSTVNVIDYVTIATIGNATDFGDLSATKEFGDSACSSSTRGVFIGGFISTPGTGAQTGNNTIDYITIATTGNATNFGTISSNHDLNNAACSSPTRGVFGGGTYTATAADAPLTPGLNYYGPTTTEYFTIATTGNSTNFGSISRFLTRAAGTSNSIRGVFGGGVSIFLASPTVTVWSNIIDYVTISTAGSAIGFGDLTVAREEFSACSDSDGGTVEAGGGGGGGGVAGRGLFAGGVNSTPTTIIYNTIDYVTISTAGNATDFGDLTVARRYISGCSSSTRGVFGGGQAPIAVVNNIDYVTIATTGNATDFGDLTGAVRYGYGTCSNSTRGLFSGGQSLTPALVVLNTIDYITIATTGNATDFGDLTLARSGVSGCSSPTRGVFGGGFVSPISSNIIEYVTIATTGNAIDFGDLISARSTVASCSSSTRGVFGGGDYLNTIDYITIATTGNATNFGNLTVTRAAAAAGAPSNSTRGLFGGGSTFLTPAIIYINTIDYITIATTGNATDFGDLSITRGELAGCSDSHGGLV